MRTSLSFVLAVLFVLAAPPSLRAQQLELGIKGGFSAYSGDLSPKEFGLYTEDWNTAGGVYLRYRPTPRFGIRVNGNFGMLSAEEDGTIVVNSDQQTEPVTRNFRSSLSEFNAVLEYDLFYIGDRESNFLAPYVYGGLGVMSFNPEGQRDGVWTELQPLRTEAQGNPANPAYDATPYNLTAVTMILGGGIRVRFSERFVIGVEVGGRKPGTDFLDDISDKQINYLDVLNNPGAGVSGNNGLAARFSNPGIADPTQEDDFTYRRGGDAEDYYFVGGLTVGITIGAGGSKKSGCYQF